MRKARRKLVLKNTSDWPDWFAKAVMHWLIPKLKTYYGTVTVNLRNTTRMSHGHAIYRSTFTTCSVQRRIPNEKFPRTVNYGRYVWSKDITVNNRLEYFVRLVAHEFRHLCRENTGISKEGREHDAEYWAEQRIAEFREVWPEMRAKYMAKERANRAAKKAKQTAPVEDSTFVKLRHATEQLKKWEKKQTHTQTHIKKWKRKIRALNAAVTRKQNRAAL
jgi:hypothetical protein